MNERIVNTAKVLEDVAGTLEFIADDLKERSKDIFAEASVLREPEDGKEKRYLYAASYSISETIDVSAKDRFEAFKKAKKEAALRANDEYVDHAVEIAPIGDNGLVAGNWHRVDIIEELKGEE